MKNLLTALVMTLLAPSVFATTIVWKGGTSGSVAWNEPTNWNPEQVPGGGDTAQFPAAYASASLHFTDSIAVASGTLTIWATTVQPQPDLYFDGGFAGNGAVKFTGGGLHLTVASSLVGGMEFNQQYKKAFVHNADAFGTGLVTLSGGKVAFVRSMTVTNDISILSGAARIRPSSSGQDPCLAFYPQDANDANVDGTLTFSGRISSTGTISLDTENNPKITGTSRSISFTGGITCTSETSCYFEAEGSQGTPRVDFDCLIDAPKMIFRHSNGVMQFHFNASGNVFDGWYIDRGNTYFTANESISSNAVFIAGTTYNAGTFYLTRGNSYAFGGFRDEMTSKQQSAAFNSTGSSGYARLTCRGTEDQGALAVINGYIDFVWAPTGDYCLDLPNMSDSAFYQKSGLYGKLVCSNGTLRLNHDFANANGIECYNGGRIVVTTNTVSLAAVKTVVVDNGSFVCNTAADKGLPELTSVTVGSGTFDYGSGRELSKLTTVSLGSGTIRSVTPFSAMTSLTVGSGTLDVPPASFDKVAALTVTAGAEFAMPAGAALPENCAVAIASDARLVSELPLVVNAAAVSVGGAPLTPGRFYSADGRAGTTALPQLGGVIVIRVPDPSPAAPVTPVEATWTGNGADSSLSTDGNWQGGTAPDFTTGAAKPVFTAAATATVDANQKISGLRIPAASAVTLNAAGANTLSIGAGVTTFAETAGTSKLTFGTKVAFTGSHRFDCNNFTAAANGQIGIDFAGGIDCLSLSKVSFVDDSITPMNTSMSGVHPVNVAFSQPSDAVCDFVFTNVSFRASGVNPLGSGLGTIYTAFTPGTAKQSSWDDIVLAGAVISNRIVSYHTQAGSDNTIRVESGTNELAGEFDFGDKTRYVNVAAGAKLVFSGGIRYASNNLTFNCASAANQPRGSIEIRNKPIVIAKNGNIGYQGDYNLDVYASGNSFVWQPTRANQTMTLFVDGAFDDVRLAKGTNGRLDLNGHDATVTPLTYAGATFSTAAAFTIDSAEPANLEFKAASGNADTSDINFTLAGKAGFLQKGTGSSTFTSTTSTSTGVLGAKENGTLVVGVAARWAGDLAIAGNGSVTFQSVDSLTNRRAVLDVADAGNWSLAIPAGQTLTVKTFRIDGIEQRGGTYAASGAERVLANVVTGTLKVIGRTGLSIVFR